MSFVLWNTNVAKNNKEKTEKLKFFAKYICQIFGHKITFLGPYEASFTDLSTGKVRISDLIAPTYQVPDIIVPDGAFVTKNLERPFSKILENVRYSLLPEGSSCLSCLYQASLPSNKLFYSSFLERHSNYASASWMLRISNKLLVVAKHIRLRHKLRRYEHYFVLPFDNDRWATQLRNSFGVTIFPKKTFLRNLRFAAEKIASDFDSLDFRQHHQAIFHPIVLGVAEEDYREYAMNISVEFEHSSVITKRHPSDRQTFIPPFSVGNSYEVPSEFAILPAELIYFQSEMRYVGFQSTLLLFTESKNRLIFEPPVNKKLEIYGEKFDPLFYSVREFSRLKGRYSPVLNHSWV